MPPQKSRKRIKSYLNKEYSKNKFLSIQDYKKMTAQVIKLRNLEHSYIKEKRIQRNNICQPKEVERPSVAVA